MHPGQPQSRAHLTWKEVVLSTWPFLPLDEAMVRHAGGGQLLVQGHRDTPTAAFDYILSVYVPVVSPLY